MTENLHWTYVTQQLPPIGEVVETRSQGGLVAKLKRGGENGRLWFLEDGSMYVYYTPVLWRRTPDDGGSLVGAGVRSGGPKPHLTAEQRRW